MIRSLVLILAEKTSAVSRLLGRRDQSAVKNSSFLVNLLVACPLTIHGCAVIIRARRLPLVMSHLLPESLDFL